MINRKALVLQEISYQEFLLLRRQVDFPVEYPKEHPNLGFAQIVSPLEFQSCAELLRAFQECLIARRASIRDRKWKRFNAEAIDEKVIEEIGRLATQTNNLIYLSFRSGVYDTSVNHEIGFKAYAKDGIVSVYACIPGLRRDQDCTWQGSDYEFTEIHALL
jgi:hypothetical protein